MRRWIVIGITMAIGVSGLATKAATAATPPTNGRILFVQDTKDCDDCILKAVEPDGTGSRRLPGSAGSYSPDGSRIAAGTQTADGRIATLVMNADGSDVTPLTPPGTLNAGCSTWAPDGRTLLCEVWDDVHPAHLPGLFTMDSDGSDLTRLTTNTLGGHDIPTAWSPDGTHVAFVMFTSNTGEFDLYTIAADGSGLTQLTDTHREEGFPDWGTAP